MAGKIFVSYRREDTDHAARHVYNHLAAAFHEPNVFIDVHKVYLGKDFRKGIDQAVDQCTILVAVIGRQWLKMLRDRQSKADTDWVRYEIERAVDRGVTVVPVTVDGAALPAAAELPEGLKKLPYYHAMDIGSGIHFDTDLDLLVAQLRRTFDALGEGAPGLKVNGPEPFWDQRQGRRRGLIALAAVSLMWLLLVLWREVLPPPAVDRPALGHLLYTNCWVSYDPTGKTLGPDRMPRYPDVASIERDLDLIKAAGFSGILTSSSESVMADVPRLARRRGLRVIMGIWDAGDRREVSQAIRQSEHVDAYCVGGDGLPDRYSVEQLRRAVDLIKRRTGRPATVSEPARRYDDDLAGIGDWLFPDAHLAVKDADDKPEARVDVGRDVALFMKSAAHMATFAVRSDRPLVFKNVAYPYGGAAGASRDRQAEFYRRLLERLNDPDAGPPVKVSIVAQGAFDAGWKKGKPFLPWDPYTGLIVAPAADLPGPAAGDGGGPARGGLLRPAGREILRWYPHLDLNLDGSGPAGGHP